MAWSYVKMSMFGAAASYSNDDDFIAAVAVLTQTPQKCPWGGSVSGHKTYKRDRLAADWQLNQDYFVERPLYNEEHFRSRNAEHTTKSSSLVIAVPLLDMFFFFSALCDFNDGGF
ncbi:unnamed protein product [Miscanthus lutarioriparius]|uniref:Uncharacterized protein n=1 Tax=Miscanthus lutarioriparius TaxID=422564 RepID=A0A811RBA4_9POAL|nr:unnamed protein product [Miscanthus lutarioriparius]